MGFFGSPPPAADNDNVVTGGLSITGGTTSDTLSVTGTSTLHTVNATGGTFSGKLTISAGGLSVVGGLTSDTLSVTSTSTFAAKLSITAGGLSVVGGLTSDTGSFSSTLSVTGTSTLHTVNATGGTFSGKLTISAGGLAVTGGVTTDTLTASGAISGSYWNGAFTVEASGVNKFSVDTSGNATVYNNLVFSNSVNQITGVYQILGAGGSQVQFPNGINATGGNVTAAGNLTINGTGTSTFGGSVTINGNMNLTSGNISAINYLYGTAGTIAQSTDEWLRLNGDGTHTSGVYFGSSIVRTDGSLEVGASGGQFHVDSSGNTTINGALTVTTESHFSNGTYSDPQSGTPRGLKVTQGIATDYLWVSGGGHIDSYVNTVGTYQVNSCALIQMAYVTIPNNGSGGYKWTFPTAIPSANGCQPLVTLNIVPGTQYFVNAGNNSRSACSYYHSSSGSLSGWIFEVSQ